MVHCTTHEQKNNKRFDMVALDTILTIGNFLFKIAHFMAFNKDRCLDSGCQHNLSFIEFRVELSIESIVSFILVYIRICLSPTIFNIQICKCVAG